MIKEKAYAKINLFLNVVNKRFDGYHDLEMVMASIELHDLLSFSKNPSGNITITSDTEITAKYEDNIVYKIALFLQEEFQVNEGAEIHIIKNIPIAAGLAGGSADAAATFRGLNRLWKLNLSLDDMAKLGINFGADIPFCIYNKLCIARGKGEEILFLKKKLKIPILLVNPNIRISTKEVFSKVVEEELKEIKISNMSSAIYNKNYELMARELHNSLEKIAFEMEPKIKEIKHQMIDLGLDGALMSGSGATVFGISKNKEKLKYVLEIMKKDYFKLLTKIR
ncbi:MAG: 4-diphosphocytidyl-2-C-methyl-D-erythritol kinase [Candidatus Izimaplasma bacterium HR2]|nr:MAG: 4-diphosphocytidyl-2-C-methyl-D-erythritol kinase [Candidatus Izimaplasma bacterium HR2]